jgi:histidyl-tRNA synthetase
MMGVGAPGSKPVEAGMSREMEEALHDLAFEHGFIEAGAPMVVNGHKLVFARVGDERFTVYEDGRVV